MKQAFEQSPSAVTPPTANDITLPPPSSKMSDYYLNGEQLTQEDLDALGGPNTKNGQYYLIDGRTLTFGPPKNGSGGRRTIRRRRNGGYKKKNTSNCRRRSSKRRRSKK